MYILSEPLTARIRRIARESELASGGAVKFEEHIALPCFGWVILRFTLDKSETTLDELDDLERMLYSLAGDEFLVDFMGSVYKKAGVDYNCFEEKLERLAKEFEEVPVPKSVHAEGIALDAAYLLGRAGLGIDEKVWEIQPEEEETTLLIMGGESRKIKTVEGEPRLYVGEVNGKLCTGLIKAALYARRKGVSLARLLA